ncbi:MAG: hypothetical protein HQL83_13835 [Magnetococcales bacterium]|nr:hypothetical protein [Magnetococcales bacterium]
MNFTIQLVSSALKRLWVRGVLLAVFCCAGLPTLAAAAAEKGDAEVYEFSADVVRRNTKENNRVTQGRMYVGRHGVRTEGERAGQKVWMIFKPEEKLVWTLFPQQKVYTVSEGMVIGRPPMPDEQESPCRKDPQFVCREMGVQAIGGRETRLWDISLRSSAPGGSIEPYARMWVDVGLKIAIREAYVDGLEVNMENLKQGAQPQSLFDLPAGFQKVSAPPQADGVKK